MREDTCHANTINAEKSHKKQEKENTKKVVPCSIRHANQHPYLGYTSESPFFQKYFFHQFKKKSMASLKNVSKLFYISTFLRFFGLIRSIFVLCTLIFLDSPQHQWPLFSETIHTKFWLMLWEKIQVHGLKMYLFLIVIISFSLFFMKHIFFARSNFLFDFLIHNIYIFRTVFKSFCIHSTRYILSIDRSSYSANWHISFFLTPWPFALWVHSFAILCK